MPRTLDIQMQVPDSAPDDAVRVAESKAREAFVVELQQRGELTLREAASGLNLTYEEYLRLLADRGLPACSDSADLSVLDMLREQMARRSAEA